MDAVELPLPADVVVSNILAKDGFTQSVVGIKESSCFNGLSVAGTSSPSGGRTKFLSRCSTSKLVSRIGKNNDVHVRGSAITSNREVSEQHPCKETHNVLPSASEVLMKKIHRKAEKPPTSNFPAVKKPRTGGIEDSPCAAGVDAKTGPVKLKHGIHSQRGEKRSSRMLARARNDAWCVKMGMAGSSAMMGGSNLLGIYGLKSGFHDITRYMEVLSINDLLDDDQGNRTGQCKGKRGTDGNHNITLAVRRACSLLSISSGAYSALADDATKNTEKHETSCQSNKGISLSKITSTNSESECNEEMPSTKKGSRDHSGVLEALATDVPLYRPKDILERLALPRAWSLDSLLSQASTSKHLAAHKSYDHSAFPLHSSTCCPPPFPWSLFSLGSSKPSNDSSKVSTNKNVPLHKWVKIDSWNGHIRNAQGHPLNQDSIIDADNVILKKLEIDRNKHDILSPVPHCLFSSVLTKPSVKSFCSSSEVDLRRGGLDSQLKPFAELHSEKIVNHIHDVEGSQKHESSEELCSVEEQRSFSVLRNLVIETENPSERTCGYDDNNNWLHSDPSVSRCDLRMKNLTPDNPTVGKMLVEHSPRLLAAAQILYKISSCRDAMRKQSRRYGKTRWPCKPSQKLMKAPRTKVSQVGKETSITTVRTVKKIDPVKVLDNVSLSKPKVSTVERKSNSSSVASVQRETVKWSIPSSSTGKPSQSTSISIKTSRQRKLGIPWPATGAAAYRSH